MLRLYFYSSKYKYSIYLYISASIYLFLCPKGLYKVDFKGVLLLEELASYIIFWTLRFFLFIRLLLLNSQGGFFNLRQPSFLKV